MPNIVEVGLDDEAMTELYLVSQLKAGLGVMQALCPYYRATDDCMGNR